MTYIHKYIDNKSDKTIILFHGTGADENDLIPLAEIVAKEFNILSLKGKVNENGMLRFFRRISDGVFDEEDIIFRAKEIKDFLLESSEKYHFDLQKSVLLGFSNGANMISALLILEPQIVRNAVLLRALAPIQQNEGLNLIGKNILIQGGMFDTMINPNLTRELESLLSNSGANIEINWVESGHNLLPKDLAQIKEWIDKLSF